MTTLNLEPEVSQFYALGLGDPIAISAEHGLGIGDLLDRIIELIPVVEAPEEVQEIAVAIVGRPNSGKSSILNRLAHEERALVHEQPHTTRDTIDTVVEFEGNTYRILDTAGIRRKRTGISDVEYYSSLRTFRAIDEADVVLLVVDGSEGPTEHDQRIARMIDSRGRAEVVLVEQVGPGGEGAEVGGRAGGDISQVPFRASPCRSCVSLRSQGRG